MSSVQRNHHQTLASSFLQLTSCVSTATLSRFEPLILTESRLSAGCTDWFSISIYFNSPGPPPANQNAPFSLLSQQVT